MNEQRHEPFDAQHASYFNTVIQKMKDQGCDGVVPDCTEIPLLVDPMTVRIETPTLKP